ncbi:conserved hypothetical protein [Prosthecochloris aestuarii DSM 271]|uniref:Uncharacterized protein n=1 Tax=Prosthecochloris aestuarii (strain DSM 271 / SK 413) TaxID=290512 RepID=B4S7U3_PROA2|nr:hypothetical protein [Prosthecochloris aestuarii]ACF46130.1 conserved hypothetical protein [Prosthecochloris aestuarii DSM 271]
MAFTITEYCDVRDRALAIGLNKPEGLALLPRNFDTASARDDLLHESAVHTVRILFRENDIPETRVEPEGHKIACIQENEFALVLPTLFVGALLLSQNPHLLSLALNVIANYATDFFKGLPGRNKVVLDVVVEDKTQKRSKKIHYDGAIDGLKEINEIAGKVFTDEEPH